MNRIIAGIVVPFLLIIAVSGMAQQQSGGNGDLQGACQLSGGQWISGDSGNWACCWADWGCYGCVDGVCKMKCHTVRCKKDNGQAVKPGNGEMRVKGLVPEGMVAPVVPDKGKEQPQVSPGNTLKQIH
ncbi:acetyltransferase [Legionella spiritensis]|uniref:acetyltransferase n=1 Tax=Legionella spiritensis TaxID=452 RepID=UPI000F6FA41B|nr:acetyltransferase [Legionella spiritensis]VEG90452.1 acetyltransferase [Legionella spiritensis]